MPTSSPTEKKHKETPTQRIKRLKEIASSLPDLPGSYQFYDRQGTIIYVGKAKSLKKRVLSYFLKEVDRFKTQVLVSKIDSITYTVVKTESDALLLENSLIKKYSPKYNILLKDGKTYPSICITKEPYPRIFKTRNIDPKKAHYFGPYSHLPTMQALLDIIRRIYKPRSCKWPMTGDAVSRNKYKACLDLHIGKCDAPCINRITREAYTQNIKQAIEILKGNTREITDLIHDQMMLAASELRFEDAEALKQKHILLSHFCAKSEVVSQVIRDCDVFSIEMDQVDKTAYVNYMHVKNGTINQSYTLECKIRLQEKPEEVLATVIPETRARFDSCALEIILSVMPEWQIPDITYTIPQRGDRKRLLELSEMNCRQYKFDRLKNKEKRNPEERRNQLILLLQEKLRLPRPPHHIECFDNSNISGAHPVAGCVVFKGFKPNKKSYRKYHVKSVQGPDDYASMREIISRRYSRMTEEQEPLPDLILTDGGIGQMHAVKDALKALKIEIPVMGMAKNDKHKTHELLYGEPAQAITIDPKSELFKKLASIQDEVHRYAITFHRDVRSKKALHTTLDDIPGIGPRTRQKLLATFGSIKNMLTASQEDLQSLVGQAKALTLMQYLKNKDAE